MKKNKIGLQFVGFDEAIRDLEKLEGDVKKTTEKALFESKKVATNELLNATTKSNYPAKGRYSIGTLRRSIDLTKNVEWEGMTASINVGYDFDKSGMESIFLMYGTPRMAKVQTIYDAVYGPKVKRQISKTQLKVFEDAIEERMA